MKLLALETTDRVAAAALYLDGEVRTVLADPAKKHAESLLPAVQRLLFEEHLTLAELDAFAVDVGPGSFTGVRIGVCTANAFGFACQKPVIAVHALEALAFDRPGRILSLIDARNGNAYAALYQDGAELAAPHACVIADCLSALGAGAVVVGSAASQPSYPTAEAIARLAAARTGAGSVSPLYLRPSQAERMRGVAE